MADNLKINSLPKVTKTVWRWFDKISISYEISVLCIYNIAIICHQYFVILSNGIKLVQHLLFGPVLNKFKLVKRCKKC
jgi:hypothetical protein